MGRGDKKTKRGKISKGSYGVSRPKRTAVVAAPEGVAVAVAVAASIAFYRQQWWL